MMKILKINFLTLGILLGSNLWAQPILSSDDITEDVKHIHTLELVTEGGFYKGFNYAQTSGLTPQSLAENNYIQKPVDAIKIEYRSAIENALSTSIKQNSIENIIQSEAVGLEEPTMGNESVFEAKPIVETVDYQNSQSQMNELSSKNETFANSSISAVFVSEVTEVYRLEPGEVEENSIQWDYFIIIGVFRNKANLRNYQKYLLETYGEATHIMLASENYYYLWTKKIATNIDASTEMARISDSRFKNNLVGHPWIWREPKRL